MFKSITFKKDHGPFKKGLSIELNRGSNYIVGDQGSGKTTLFNLFKAISNPGTRASAIQILDWDLKNNDKKYPLAPFSFETELEEAKQKIGLNEKASHGQAQLTLANAILNRKKSIIVLDEPDVNLSVRSCYRLFDSIAAACVRYCQVIAFVHNPTLIRTDVYSLEHNKWMKPNDFLETQRIY